MKKIWGYVSAGLAGALVLAIIVIKWLVTKSGVTLNVKNIKNKRSSGDMSVVVPIEVKSAEKRRKTRNTGIFQRLKNNRKVKKDAKAIRKSNKKL